RSHLLPLGVRQDSPNHLQTPQKELESQNRNDQNPDTQQTLDRSLKLVQSSSGTQQQVDTARSQVEQYRAAVQSDDAAIASAQASLDYTTIRAPIDGRTGIRNVDVGNIVSSSDAAGIVTLSQIRPISVVFSIPQQQLAKVNAASGGGQLSVEAIAGDGKSVIDNGVLAAVDNQVDATTGTVRIKANFPNDKLALWPGAFVNARLLVETLRGVIVVPTAAVQRGPNGTFVYLLKPDQTVGMKMVKLGQQDDMQTVIAEGVADGDKVVTTGFSRLRDGEHVEVAASQPPAATPGNPPGNPNEERKPNRRPQKTGGPEAASAAPVALPEAKQ
ncbi:efflux RND transporter periplasmic adaptor subunit, partial [Neorhizobium galegae]|uniref:efflux RND transporter periplasmic adaptor subunit n=1 Tax=Neorhizobium galegae TaxID=399 RepID=UPI002101F440